MASLAQHAWHATRAAAPRWSARGILQAFLLISVGSVVIFPLALLIFNSFQVVHPNDTVTYSLDGWRAALSEPGIVNALINTVTLTVGRQAVALVVAVCFAWLIARTDIPGRSWLDFAFWAVFFLPALPMTLGWILLLDPNFGVLNELTYKLFGARLFNVYSWWGIVWVHLVTGSIAIKVVLLIPAFRNLDSSFEEASRMSGVSTLGTLWRISIPLILPAILIVTLMSIASSLQAFEVELILGPQAGIDVYSTIMYRFITQSPAQFGPATVLGVLVMLAMAPFAIWQYQIVTRRSYTTMTGSYRANRIQLRRWRWPLFALTALYLLVSLVIPSALLVIGTFMKFFGAFEVPDPWTLEQWRTVITDPIFIQSLVNTLILGIGAGVLAMIWFSLAAYTIVRYRGAPSRVLDFLCWLPWAVPGIIMGLGFLWMVLSVGFLRPLHSTMLIMILAVTLGAITPGTQMIKAGLLQIDTDLEGASWVGGASFLYTLRRIVVPLLAPTLVAVGILTFVAAVRDIGRIVFVVGGTNRPLAMLQLDLIVSERLEAAAVVGVIITILSLGVAMVARAGGLRVASES